MAEHMCSVNDCPKPARCRGWCVAHYSRWCRHGDPIAGRYKRPAYDRIMDRVTVEGECLIVSGHRSRSGHVRVWDNDAKRQRGAHLLVWEHLNGPVPDGLVVRHSCDVGACVNRGHLSLGTVADNNRDRDERGRHVALRGEEHGSARLTDAEVDAIRRLLAKGYKQRDIADQFGVTQSHVSLIKRGLTRAR